MIPAIGVRILHRGIEMKPDYDGEMREFELDAVLELDMKLYKEENVELLSDLYSTNRELVLDTGEARFDRPSDQKYLQMQSGGTVKNQQATDRILQICHSSGSVKLDEAEASKGGRTAYRRRPGGESFISDGR